MTDWYEIFFRLGSATLIGGVLGLNRNLHHKPSGLRTLSLVGLGSALVVLMAADGTADPSAASRVIQGVITGLGFLGAGLIVREETSAKVHGLTTAATLWIAACLGSACGLGAWRAVAIACVLVAFVLLAGGPIERAVHRKFGGDERDSGKRNNAAGDHDENVSHRS